LQGGFYSAFSAILTISAILFASATFAALVALAFWAIFSPRWLWRAKACPISDAQRSQTTLPVDGAPEAAAANAAPSIVAENNKPGGFQALPGGQRGLFPPSPAVPPDPAAAGIQNPLG